jgi:hypothetical protein
MTNNLHTYQLMHEALTELQPEIEKAASKPVPLAPSLVSTLDEIGPLPREALFLGLASDGLPVLLDLHDPQPGPILIVADPGGGKTSLMQMIAQAGMLMHTAEDMQFGVITNYPEEWERFAGQTHTLGIFPTYHNKAMEFMRVLSGWAHSKKTRKKSILLLIDDLESMEHLDFEDRGILRWLLFRGPVRGVWPIVSLNADRLDQVANWLESFRTHLFGHIKEARTAKRLTGDSSPALTWLHKGLQFALREDDRWLKFWVPEI